MTTLNSDSNLEELLSEHFESPLNYGILDGFTNKVTVKNESCGDVLDLYTIFKKGKLANLSFESKSCALSLASASIFFDKIKGKSIKELEKISEEEVFEILGFKPITSRTNCVLLPFRALQKSLQTLGKK